MIILEDIRESLAGNMGSPYNTNPSLISFSTIKSGSVIVGGVMSVQSGSSASSILSSAANSIVASGSYSCFALTSATFTGNGFNPSSSSSSQVNLPLVLGLSIPLGIVFIIVVVVVIIKVRARTN